MGKVRLPAVAGMFYPDSPEQLQQTVHSLLLDAEVPDCWYPPKALIVPHAGYRYSGRVAAAAYAALKPFSDHYHRVVILGPNHRRPLRGVAGLSADWLNMPLGAVAVDRLAIQRLRSRGLIGIDDLVHLEEHAIEVQLPFLQSVLTRFSVVPLVVGQTDATAVAAVVESFWSDPETLLLVSSDLSHYHDERTAREIDRDTCHRIQQQQTNLVSEQACGAYAINGLLMALASHPSVVQLVAQATSADAQAGFDRVVGYGAFTVLDSPAA